MYEHLHKYTPRNASKPGPELSGKANKTAFLEILEIRLCVCKCVCVCMWYDKMVVQSRLKVYFSPHTYTHKQLHREIG